MTGNELRQMAEELNRLLQDAEQRFISMNLGVGATIPITHGQSAEHWTTQPLDTGGKFLSFVKRGNDWGLFVISTYDGKEAETPLLRASRKDRIEAAKHLDELCRQLVQNAEATAKDLVEAKRSVVDFLNRSDE